MYVLNKNGFSLLLFISVVFSRDMIRIDVEFGAKLINRN